MKKTIVGTWVFLMFLTFAAQRVSASEGYFELRNQIGEKGRCLANSVLMQDLNFRVLVSCRDIIYPGGTDIFNYIVWATPTTGNAPLRLGELGLGKVELRTPTQFTSLYVTKERVERAKSPTGVVVMRGNHQSFAFLDTPSQQTPTPKPSELGSPNPSATPQAKKSAFSILRVGGAIAFIALFGVILMIFLITRR